MAPGEEVLLLHFTLEVILVTMFYSADNTEHEYGDSSRDHYQENVDEESVAGSPGEQSQLGIDFV